MALVRESSTLFTSEVLYECGRIEAARLRIPDIVERFKRINEDFSADLAGGLDAHSAVIKHATTLWQSATSDARTDRFDDRSLYWGRLVLEKTLLDAEQQQFIPLLEEVSRNCKQSGHGDADVVAITGFDPFNLSDDITQCNPSGAFALALDGTRVRQWHIKSMIFPVRYADFDNHCVEDVLKPVLMDSSTRMVITVSMGREAFDLERFPGNCRGNARPDNQGVAMSKPALLPRMSDRPGFIEFSLPAARLRSALPAAVRNRVKDNHDVSTVEDGALRPSALRELDGKTPIAGSGGNFLSNEISYRALALQAKLGTNLPVGHIHVPRMKGFDPNQLESDFGKFVEILRTLVGLVQAEREDQGRIS